MEQTGLVQRCRNATCSAKGQEGPLLPRPRSKEEGPHAPAASTIPGVEREKPCEVRKVRAAASKTRRNAAADTLSFGLPTTAPFFLHSA